MNNLSGIRPLRFLPAAALTAALAAGPALAHHSFNMFALDQVVTVSGTVENYDFKMPHVWLYMLVPAKDGSQQKWGFEAHAPNMVARQGWGIHTLNPGDKISVAMHPMKDGSTAGSVIYITLADGKQLWNAQSLNEP